MMTGIFLAMTLAFGLGLRGARNLAVGAAGLCLGMAVWLFLWEIYSPETGFRMPWIDTRLVLPQTQGRA